MKKKECSKEFHSGVPIRQEPWAGPRHHVEAHGTCGWDGHRNPRDLVFAGCPEKAVFRLADSPRAKETISSLNNYIKAAKPMIKDLYGSIIIIKYAWTQCDFFILYTGLKSTLNHLIYMAMGAETELFK